MRMWQAAEQLCAEVDALLPTARRGARDAADHLDRSTNSVLFNIAEGAGAFRPRVKVSAYEVARKEANEVRAILRRLVIKKVLTEHEIRRAYNLASAIISMLTSAIIKLQARDGSPNSDKARDNPRPEVKPVVSPSPAVTSQLPPPPPSDARPAAGPPDVQRASSSRRIR